MSLPASLDINDALESAGRVLQNRTERAARTLQHLSPAFAILNDATGRAKGPESLALYAEYFAAQKLSPESVYQAVRRIAIDWEKAYWPSPEFIANLAHRLLREMHQETRGSADRAREIETVMRTAADREWEDRSHRAGEWFEAHPQTGKLLIAGVDADIAKQIADHPRWRIATSDRYRRAFRQGAIISEVLRRVAIERTPIGRRELRILGERFPTLAVDPYQDDDPASAQAAA